MKVLVVEDDTLLLEFIERCLQQQKIDVELAKTGDKGYQKARSRSYDVIVLDVNLPGMQGTEICEKLRAEQIKTPVLFLSANTAKNDRIQGLELGGDDYLVKPFEYEELIARVRALARRPQQLVPDIIRYNGLEIDTTTHAVHYGDTALHLTPKEFELLVVLARNPETVLSREYLLKHIWGVTVGNTSNRLEVCVRGLRRKLDSAVGEGLINTEYGVGYRLSS